VVAATATPGSKANLPTEVLGTYRDAGETSVVWTFLGAGDPYCLDTVVTETTCMHIERTNFGTIVDYGPVTLVSDGLLELVLLFDEDGACLNFPIQIPFSLDEAGNLTLNTIGTCIEGAPRNQLIRV
jgi:hypothetical protein